MFLVNISLFYEGRFITHGDELNALFRIPNIESMTKGVKPKMNSRDAKASQIMISLWVDFAYGK